MRTFALIASGVLLLAASAATAQSAPAEQPAPAAHAQHHPAKHSASAHGQRCCCEKEMHRMMAMMHEMMAMHKGGMHHDMKMPKPGEPSH